MITSEVRDGAAEAAAPSHSVSTGTMTNPPPTPKKPVSVPTAATAAAPVGALTGFFGVGGGGVMVPVLGSLWLDAPLRRAVATSLVR